MGIHIMPPLYMVVMAAPRFGPPETHYFYPDAHPEVTSVDGHCWRDPGPPYETYDKLRIRPGTNAEDSGNIFAVRIFSDEEEDLWRSISRGILLYDTSGIPEGASVTAAKLRLGVYTRSRIANWPNFAVGVVSSLPASNTDIVPADYGCLGTILRSDTISPFDVEAGETFELTLNAKGLAQITPGGITKLGLREMGYDAADVCPPWVSLSDSNIWFFSADIGVDGSKPRLEVTYLPPLGEYEETYDTDNLTASAYNLIYNRIEFKRAADVTAIKAKTKNAGDYTLRVKSDNGSITYQTVTVEDAPADSWIIFRIATLEVTPGMKFRMEITRPEYKAYAAAGLYDGYYWKNNMAGFNSSEFEYTHAMGIIYEFS